MSRVEQIGDCQLILADMREVLPTLGYVDTVITDLPYGIEKTAGGSINTPKNKGGYTASFSDTQEELAELAKTVCDFIASRQLRAAITPGRTNMWHYSPSRDVGMFYQPAATSMSFWGRATWQPILFYGKDPYIGKTIHPLHYTLTEAPERNGHPCPKPINAWTWLVKRATLQTDIILDPFMGSGTTGVACAKLGRKFIGIEIDLGYFEIACKRIQKAYDQPDFFIEKPAPAKQTQEALL